MRILEDYKGLIFLHPMKTAMTSVSYFIKEQMKKHYQSYDYMPATGHFTPDEILWRFKNPVDVFDSYYCVLFVRNPYDRLVSFYHHMRQIGGHAEGICERLSFKEFAMYPRIRGVMRPMVDYLYCEGERIVDYLGHYESLSDSVYRLIDIIGFGKATLLVKGEWLKSDRYMFTKHSPYMEFYNEELMDCVYKQYEDDFKEFNYGR